MFVLPETINHQNALSIRQEGLTALKKTPNDCVVSCANLTLFDSTALSVLMAFVRVFPALQMIDAPPKLASLSKVYGLETILPLINKGE